MNIEVKQCHGCVFANYDNAGYTSSCNLSWDFNDTYIDIQGMDDFRNEVKGRHKDCPLNDGLVVTVKAENK